MPLCSIDGCEEKVLARGWCGMHYKRWQDTGDPQPNRPRYARLNPAKPYKRKTDRRLPGEPRRICIVDGCEKYQNAKKFCDKHYRKFRLYGDPLADHRRRAGAPCVVDGCDRPRIARGWCDMHYHRWRKYGDPVKGKNRSDGKRRIKNGYVIVARRGHPNAWKNGDIFEHIVVMAEKLGRPLRSGESVHHLNGIRGDNRPENLELWLNGHRKGQRVTDLIADAHELLERYKNDLQLWPEHLRP